MIKSLITAALLALGLVSTSAASSLSEIQAASFKLSEGATGICSSTYIGQDNDGYNLFLTAAHCLGSSSELNIRRQVFDEDMEILREEVFYVDVASRVVEKDVGILRMREKFNLGIEGVDVANLVEANLAQSVGSPVLVAGFPTSSLPTSILTQSFTFTEGMMTGKTREATEALGLDTPLVKTTANVAPGSSGGALYSMIDGEWKLVGTTVAMNNQFQFMSYFSTPESVNYVIGVVIG